MILKEHATPTLVVTTKNISEYYQIASGGRGVGVARGIMALVGNPWASVTLGLSLPSNIPSAHLLTVEILLSKCN